MSIEPSFLLFSAKSTLGAPDEVPASIQTEPLFKVKSSFAASVKLTDPDVKLPVSEPVL